MTKRDNAHHHRGLPGQRADEEVLMVLHRFPIVLRWPLIWSMVIILVAMMPWSLANYYGSDLVGIATNWLWIGLIILFFYAIWSWVSYYYSIYVLTSHQVMVIRQKGLFKRNVSALSLNNIQNVNYQVDGFQAAVFGYGDIDIETLSGSGHLKLDKVHHPAQVQQIILTAVQKHNSQSSAPTNSTSA